MQIKFNFYLFPFTEGKGERLNNVKQQEDKMEELQKALHDCGFLCDNLKYAMGKANNVECILLLDMIGKAADLKRDIDRLILAHEMDKEIV